MMYVALAACGSTAVVAVVFGNLLRTVIRQAARREDLLVNQLCNMAGRPWTPPPAREPELEEEPVTLSLAPEQYVA